MPIPRLRLFVEGQPQGDLVSRFLPWKNKVDGGGRGDTSGSLVSARSSICITRPFNNRPDKFLLHS